jgi:hypothetical protein
MKGQLDRVLLVARKTMMDLLVRRATLGGPVIFGTFCLASLWIWLPPGSDEAPTPEVGAQDLTTRLAEHRANIAGLIPVTGDRPLFQADRRPVAAPEAPSPPPEADLLLVGILGDGEERIALVRRSTSPDLFQIKSGGRLGKWEILTVDLSSITVLEDDGTTFTLRLDG